MDESWTLSDLVAQAQTRLEELPAPKNGQVRAVPDERTIRYYAAIGLLDRPSAMRGRTALYGRKHLAQVVAIKRMQSAGHSLADIQQLWPTMDEPTLARMTGVQLVATPKPARKDFWKREVQAEPEVVPPSPSPTGAASAPATVAPYVYPAPIPRLRSSTDLPGPPLELRIEVAPGIHISIALPEDAPVALTPADVRAYRAAAAPLVTELAKRGLTAHVLGTLEEKP